MLIDTGRIISVVLLIQSKKKTFPATKPVYLGKLQKINYPYAQDFGPYSRRDEACISGYVRFIATKKTEQKTSKMGSFFFVTSLTRLSGFEVVL